MQITTVWASSSRPSGSWSADPGVAGDEGEVGVTSLSREGVEGGDPVADGVGEQLELGGPEVGREEERQGQLRQGESGTEAVDLPSLQP